ncbi:hypothetical protein SNE40_021684 [Patella caerulea]|uniref:Uncharacterized protein n=1 Tax=Patella caerulea TaxID=87958 RepID=A0AAN8GBJ4_PATCE
MRHLIIDERGVKALIRKLKPDKASGPDKLPNRVLQQCSEELAPGLTHIYISTRNHYPQKKCRKTGDRRTLPPYSRRAVDN